MLRAAVLPLLIAGGCGQPPESLADPRFVLQSKEGEPGPVHLSRCCDASAPVEIGKVIAYIAWDEDEEHPEYRVFIDGLEPSNGPICVTYEFLPLTSDDEIGLTIRPVEITVTADSCVPISGSFSVAAQVTRFPTSPRERATLSFPDPPSTTPTVTFALLEPCAPFPPLPPDQIVFSNTPEGGYSDIYTIDPSTGVLSPPLTNNDSVFDQDPAWSPDRSQIAFVSNLGNPQGDFDLFLMNPDGSGQRRVTSLAAQHRSVSDPAWSPTGDQIAVALGATGHETDIWIITPTDPPSLEQLTFQPQNPAIHTYATSPVWNGTEEILFVRDGWVYVVAATGGDPTFVFSPASDDDSIEAINLAGVSLVFANKSDIHTRLVRTDDLVDLADVTAGAAQTADRAPSWSPTGGWVVFVREAGETGKRLHVVDVDDDGPNTSQELAGQPEGDNDDPDWGFPPPPPPPP